MDMTTMPGWAQTALAITTVVIVGLTMLASFLDWAVPRLRALGPKGEPERALSAIERFAKALTTVLGCVHRFVPRLTIVEPNGAVASKTVAQPTTSTTCAPVLDPKEDTPGVATDTNPPHWPSAD